MSDTVHARLSVRTLVAYNKDYYGGALMFLLGAGAALKGRSYGIGTLSNMGSGFFPVALGVLLALIGATLMLGAKREVRDEPVGLLRAADSRGWLCIVFGMAAFVCIGRFGGLVPATFAIVFISALGDRQNTLRTALILSTVMVAIGVVVFRWALQLQLPLFHWG